MLLHELDAQHAANGSPWSTTSMDNQARQWSEVSRLLFFVNSSCRINFLVYYRNRLEGHTIFPYIVYVVLFIAVLLIVGLRGHPNIVHTFLFTQIGCKILLKQFCSNSSSLQDDVSNSKHLRATCSGFPSVAEHVAHTWHCIAYRCY
jgi:hypothetical protein